MYYIYNSNHFYSADYNAGKAQEKEERRRKKAEKTKKSTVSKANRK